MNIYFKIGITICIFLLCVNLSAQSIAINEVMSSNSTTISDEDGSFEDWIEIYNYGTTSVNLSGFGLSDQTDNLLKWKFPAVTLPAKGYLLVWASDKNRTVAGSPLHTNFKIKSGGETLILSNASGVKINESPAVAIATDNSYGRKPDGTGSWSFFTQPTPNDSNTGATSATPEKVAINEFVSSNTTGIKDQDGAYEDWIELYNYGTTPINLSGYGLSDDRDLPYKWVFPSVTISAGQYLLVWASDKNRRVAGNELHTNFKISSGGETLFLTNAAGVLTSGGPSVNLAVDTSYGRQPDGTGSWLFFNTPTPRASNTGSGNTTSLEPPIFSHNSGLYNSQFNLQLSTNVQNATIVYTLDGSEPDINNLSGTSYTYKNKYPLLPGDPYGDLLSDNFKSYSYSIPIIIKDVSSEVNQLSNKNSNQFELYEPPTPVRKATTVRAKVYLNGKGSETKSKTFFVWSGGNPYEIPVISIQLPETHLFDYNDGIYNSGVDFDTWRQNNPSNNQSWRPEINNYWRSGRDWEFSSNVELFAPKTLNSIQNIKAGFRIHGNNSRIGVIKNLRLYARSEYDSKNEFEHRFFNQIIPNAAFPYNNQYKRLLLRGDGAGGSIAYDVAFSKAMQPIYNGVTRIEPAIHFINGEYWGLTAFRDRLDEFHYELNFGVNSDNFIQVSCNGSQCGLDEGENGDFETYINMRDFILDNDMSNQSLYIQATNMLDMSSFIDHVVMVIFASNNSYERKYWRARTKEDDAFGDGKWRVNVQDFEASLSNNNWLEYLSDLGRSDNNAVLANLLKNTEFKNKFINRFSDILNTVYSSSHFTSVINETFTAVAPYLAEDKNRANRSDFYKEEEKQDLLDWANDRPNAQRELIKNQFSISKTVNINLDVSYYNAGYIKINTIDVRGATPGVSESPYPWSGVYFEGIPITLEAKELPGFTFSNWSGDVSGNNKTLTVTPTSDMQITANYTPNSSFKHLVYFWLFDDDLENDTPLQSVNATYSRNNTDATISYTSSLSGYPFNSSNVNWRKASLERKNNPTAINYMPFANNDVSYADEMMRGLQIKQPFRSGSLENMFEITMNTTHFKDIKIALAIESDGAAQTLLVDYWNGSNWITSNISSSYTITNSYEKKEIDFSNVSLANNNSNFKVRFRFNGTNMTEENGKTVSINNISVEGVETTLSAESFEEKESIKIYPNPSRDFVRIQSNYPVEDVKIYSVLGQIVYQKQFNSINPKVDINQLKEGVYLMRVFTNNKIISKRIIKQ